ncbi:uncharacterized protein EI97DRAFT_372350 [Westerdykella ornata]|uniref:Kinetochore protein fta4 n=1 Tax=Westerdykella ornata TaxID=318751 RepID=A0A6A6JR49_WESOR|nr:uncharacterized protein EI97DRAFT_372350 [Westerdykella ornata]KAF2278745.1 hypothetical protein EI97DRAFT_372350 [Westerdykella ornata]
MSQSAVVERKRAFLRRQKQILTRGIPPSNRLLKIAEQGGIQTKVLNDIMLKVNRDLKRHGREVYGSQMTDHVVEQIDLLYWEAGERAVEGSDDAREAGEDGDALYRGDDLTLDSCISKLPSTWDISADNPPQSSDDNTMEVDQDAYMEAVTRLQDLSARRLTLQQKLTTYRTLLSLLEPYRKPQENIQPNLVGRDAPLALELAQTRTLAIRVAGRVGDRFGDVQVPATEEEVGEELLKDDRKKKVNDVLAGW